MKIKQLILARHIIWRAHDHMIRDEVKWVPTSKRPLVHPTQRWMDRVEKKFNTLGIKNGE